MIFFTRFCNEISHRWSKHQWNLEIFQRKVYETVLLVPWRTSGGRYIHWTQSWAQWKMGRYQS